MKQSQQSNSCKLTFLKSGPLPNPQKMINLPRFFCAFHSQYHFSLLFTSRKTTKNQLCRISCKIVAFLKSGQLSNHIRWLLFEKTTYCPFSVPNPKYFFIKSLYTTVTGHYIWHKKIKHENLCYFLTFLTLRLLV